MSLAAATALGQPGAAPPPPPPVAQAAQAGAPAEAAVAQAAAASPSAAVADPAGTAPSPADLRTALSEARDKVIASPESMDARLALAKLLRDVGEYREGVVQLAEVARMEPDHPQLAPTLELALTQWHAADPPRPGQASAYADYCKAAKEPVGGARLQRFSKLALAICDRLAAADASPPAQAPGAATASAAAATPGKPGGVTQQSLLRIWLITAIGAALFIGGGTWWTRKYRGKDAPRRPPQA